MEAEAKRQRIGPRGLRLEAIESRTLYRAFAACTLLSIIMILPVLLFPAPSSEIPIGEQLSYIVGHQPQHLVYWGTMLILMCLGVGVNLGLCFLGLRSGPVLALVAFVFSIMSTVLVTTPKFIQFWSSLIMAQRYAQNPGPEVTTQILAQYSQWMVQPMYSLFQAFEVCGFVLHLGFLFPISYCLLVQRGRYRLIGTIIFVEGFLMAVGLSLTLVAPGLREIALLWNKTGMGLHVVLLFILSWAFLGEAKQLPSAG